MQEKARERRKEELYRAADEAARAQARRLLAEARTAVLGLNAPEGGAPLLARIGFARAPDGALLSLISALARHHAALRRNPLCTLLIGDPAPRGDPLAAPRLRITAQAVFMPPEARPALREIWLHRHPKAKLYVDFADFGFVRFHPESAFLNGGFGKAFLLNAADLE